jgi:hypothetical protein
LFAYAWLFVYSKGMGKDETFSAKKRLTFEDDNLNEVSIMIAPAM